MLDFLYNITDKIIWQKILAIAKQTTTTYDHKSKGFDYYAISGYLDMLQYAQGRWQF